MLLVYIVDFQCFWGVLFENVEKSAKKVVEKFGGKEKSRTFATRLRKNGKFIDNIEKR